MNKRKPRRKTQRIERGSMTETNFDAPYSREAVVTDPLTGYEASLRAVQGYQAQKRYLCPECNDLIEVGTAHLVVVPTDAPDLRRHWHNYCWVRRQNRVPGATKKKKARRDKR